MRETRGDPSQHVYMAAPTHAQQGRLDVAPKDGHIGYLIAERSQRLAR